MNDVRLSSLATEDLDDLMLKIEKENSELPRIFGKKQKYESEGIISS